MIEFIKKICFRVLGMKSYLRILHRGFFILFDSGWLRSNYIYKYHYFVKHLIQPGDVVVDLGANLGYYTRIFCRLLKGKGKVIAIEPVKPFYETVAWATSSYPNKTLYNYALGLKDDTITLSTPGEYGYLRAGLSHVVNEETQSSDFVFEAKMKRASELLGNESRIDYIKCDIEGYEEFVLPEMRAVIEKHQPVLQIESWGKHLEVVQQMMNELNYRRYSVYKGKLILEFDNDIEHGDYLFLPSGKEATILQTLKAKGLA
ncbi:MAG TPA: FkbM family methyltransferase [Chitinophagaceae bacterium]|nr:FkbM family methyltransferase [Chitinophagaceae bacterium]